MNSARQEVLEADDLLRMIMLRCEHLGLRHFNLLKAVCPRWLAIAGTIDVAREWAVLSYDDFLGKENVDESYLRELCAPCDACPLLWGGEEAVLVVESGVSLRGVKIVSTDGRLLRTFGGFPSGDYFNWSPAASPLSAALCGPMLFVTDAFSTSAPLRVHTIGDGVDLDYFNKDMRGVGPGQLTFPAHIFMYDGGFPNAQDTRHALYVSDATLNRISIFSFELSSIISTWEHFGTIGGKGQGLGPMPNKYVSGGMMNGMPNGSGEGDGEFTAPAGIAVGRRQLYVADQENARIQVFALTGEYVRTILLDEGSLPGGLAIGLSDRLLVGLQDRLLVLTLDGALLQEVIVPPPQSPFACATMLWSLRASQACAYATDLKRGIIHKFKRIAPGEHVREFDAYGVELVD